jgi:hypothetical protein
MGLRLGESDRVAPSTPKGANEFQGKGRVTSTHLWQMAQTLGKKFLD